MLWQRERVTSLWRSTPNGSVLSALAAKRGAVPGAKARLLLANRSAPAATCARMSSADGGGVGIVCCSQGRPRHSLGSSSSPHLPGEVLGHPRAVLCWRQAALAQPRQLVTPLVARAHRGKRWRAEAAAVKVAPGVGPPQPRVAAAVWWRGHGRARRTDFRLERAPNTKTSREGPPPLALAHRLGQRLGRRKRPRRRRRCASGARADHAGTGSGRPAASQRAARQT